MLNRLIALALFLAKGAAELFRSLLKRSAAWVMLISPFSRCLCGS